MANRHFRFFRCDRYLWLRYWRRLMCCVCLTLTVSAYLTMKLSLQEPGGSITPRPPVWVISGVTRRLGQFEGGAVDMSEPQWNSSEQSDVIKSVHLQDAGDSKPVELDVPNQFHSDLVQQSTTREEENFSHVLSEVASPPFKLQRVQCGGPWPMEYPECAAKMNWMAENWYRKACYSAFGVDGSQCSFQQYLSEVEHFCPRLPGRDHNYEKATVRYSFDSLYEMLSSISKFDWINERIKFLWPIWTRSLQKLESQQSFRHRQKKILIHIGALSMQSGFKLSEGAGQGGPLGELVQWSDLIASLYLLGHNLVFSVEVGQLRGIVGERNKKGCPVLVDYDLVYLDIVGLTHFYRALGPVSVDSIKCTFRVLDTFGTEPMFNFREWKPEWMDKNPWGNWDLNPRQFLTLYPHSPDNSFMGFVIYSNLKNDEEAPAKRNQSLVYGKEVYMWKDKQPYLDVISRHLEVHATIHTKEALNRSIVPQYVHNHGLLNFSSVQLMLQESKLFIGMGFPYEGPAPLEAIANGCFYLNPRLIPPVDHTNTEFFARKPTSRSLTSQNPYTEMFIGKPYVYTIDMNDPNEVEAALVEMLAQPNPPPYVPYEFTFEGMLERLMMYIENQEFCVPGHQWPPRSTLMTRIGKLDESCKDACYRHRLVCEPELFPVLQTHVEAFLKSQGMNCLRTVTEHSVHGPSINVHNNVCSLQKDRLLMSCVGHSDAVHRVCPCRQYRKGQVALCVTCVR